MKKYIIIAITVLSLLTVAACSDTKDEDNTTTKNTNTTESTVYDDGFGGLEDGSSVSGEAGSSESPKTTSDNKTTEKNTEKTSSSESVSGGLDVEEFSGGDSEAFNNLFNETEE